MNSLFKSHMRKDHQHTYDAIFQHPIAHDLHRRDVIAMLGELAEVNEEHNGNLKVMRNGQTLVLHATQDKNVTTTDELMLIRHFLERSELPDSSARPDAPDPDAPPHAGHFLVVIDHREARIFQAELHGAIPQRITPYDPHGYGRNLHYVQDEASGQRKPERKSFYEAVAKTLRPATEILLFGNGTGASSAMEALLADLEKNHPDIAKHVVGSVAIDAQHLTEDQLLAKAREFYEKRPPSSTAK